MDLTPPLPPGRANRKARAFNAEIHRLRAAGYTFEAIRLALQVAGLQVSRSTVKREAAKRLTNVAEARQCHAPPSFVVGPAPSPQGSVGARASPTSYLGDARSGMEIVAEFLQGQVTNPLMQEDVS